jgi:DNA repair exonuclease SbcCD ATPase subunit
MSQRLVAIIDADLNLAGHLQEELQRHRLDVEVAADSNDLMARKDGLPELIVLCIDPKRTGWAVCNRLRKSPLLKTIPLIITSAEATEKDFDDHKKLKTRAEEYLHKPFSADALLDKIATLIGLPEAEAIPVSDSQEIELEPEEISAVDLEPEEVEVPAEEGGVVDEMTLGGAETGGDGDDESTRIGFTAEIDGEVDLETNAAFAAIGLDEPTEAAAREAGGDSPFDEEFSLPDPPRREATAPVSVAAPAPVAAAPAPAPAAASAHADLESAPVPKVAADELDLGLDEVARGAEAIVASTATPHSNNAAHAAHAIEETRREVERLRKENEELRTRPKQEAAPAQASSFSREREFLNLRETINKKEKEVLDLRDALDSKERQILDGKDKLRDADRRLREVEERSLQTERDLVAAREKVEALSADKERSVEREKQTKGRLEDTQKALARGEEEIEQWRNRHTADLAAAEERLQQASGKHKEELGALRQVNAEALADLKTEHQNAVASEREAHGAEKEALLEQHAAAQAELRDQHKSTLEGELKAAERRHAEALVDLEGKHEEEQRAAAGRHQEALKAQAEEARRALEQAVAEQLAERARLESEHARAIDAMDAAKQAELAEAAEQGAQQLAAAVAQRSGEAEAELKGVREQHARKLQALEESHEDLRAGMLARHNTATDELKRQHAAAISEFEGVVSERDHAIAEHQAQKQTADAALQAAQEQQQTQGQIINDLSGQLETARTELQTRAQTLEERAHRVAELEQESARYQDQILRAYQRIKADESIVARAKKALAIALTLLEESDDGNEQASS